MKKECAKCGKPFEGRLDRAIYCSNVCRASASKAKKTNSGGAISAQHGSHTDAQPFPSQPKRIMPDQANDPSRPPMKLDALSTYIVDDLKDKNRRLHNKIDRLREEKEKLQTQTKKLKSELLEITHQLTEKPKGLAGFVANNPTLVSEAGPLLNGVLGLVKDIITPKTETKHPLLEWYNRQSAEMQNGLVVLLQQLESDPQNLTQNMTLLHNCLKAKAPNEPKKTGLGSGFRR